MKKNLLMIIFIFCLASCLSHEEKFSVFKDKRLNGNVFNILTIIYNDKYETFARTEIFDEYNSDKEVVISTKKVFVEGEKNAKYGTQHLIQQVYNTENKLSIEKYWESQQENPEISKFSYPNESTVIAELVSGGDPSYKKKRSIFTLQDNEIIESYLVIELNNGKEFKVGTKFVTTENGLTKHIAEKHFNQAINDYEIYRIVSKTKYLEFDINGNWVRAHQTIEDETGVIVKLVTREIEYW